MFSGFHLNRCEANAARFHTVRRQPDHTAEVRVEADDKNNSEIMAELLQSAGQFIRTRSRLIVCSRSRQVGSCTAVPFGEVPQAC